MSTSTNPYEVGLEKNAANFVPLTPIGFLLRSAAVYPNRPAVVHGERRYTWRETLERCRRLASALAARGVGRGDTVAVMAPNVPEAFEAHFGVPMAGAVLNALNIRLDAEHDRLHPEARRGQGAAHRHRIRPGRSATLWRSSSRSRSSSTSPIPAGRAASGSARSITKRFSRRGDPDFAEMTPEDEWDAIALNYTSGTTGNPKGVVYHHRGAYLNALGNILVWGMRQHPVYLWTLPMFHCNGWCFPWTVTALAGTHVCLRRVEAAAIYEAIEREGVTHLCGAPVVMNMLLNAGAAG